MFESPILRVTGGYIDTVNDAVIGGFSGISGVSQVAGQLGAPVWLDDNQLVGFYKSATQVFGGRFRYVRLAAAATAVVRGQIVFWDQSVADNLFQVTTSEAGSSQGAMWRAGIVLNASWTAGNYSFIQDIGLAYVKFRGTLTSAGSTGGMVTCAAVGAGVDNGFADYVSTANPTLFSDVNLLMGRMIGSAAQLPVNGGLTQVYLNGMNLRG